MEKETQHSINLLNRENLSVSGVKDVGAFNEQEITALCNDYRLIVKGEGLHIDELSIDSGILNVSGKISSITYVERISSNSIVKRLFGG